MFGLTCNIDKIDRISRCVFGLILCIAAYFHASYILYMIMGIILIVEGLIGWCYIPVLLSRFKKTKDV